MITAAAAVIHLCLLGLFGLSMPHEEDVFTMP